MNCDLNLKIKKTERKKTVSIEIKEDYVQVSAPKILSDMEINIIINRKKNWIKKKVLLQKSRAVYLPKKFINGEILKFLGKNYKLNIVNSSKEKVELKENKINVYLKRKNTSIKSLLEIWYRANGLKVITRKINYYNFLIGVKPNSINLRSFKKRWGSCNSKGDIAFNWRLLMAPNSVINYVVIHELCHLIHFNHSKNFWKTVKYFHPNYKIEEDWLKKYSKALIW